MIRSMIPVGPFAPSRGAAFLNVKAEPYRRVLFLCPVPQTRMKASTSYYRPFIGPILKVAFGSTAALARNPV